MSRSLINAANTYDKLLAGYSSNNKSFLYKKYATFLGTNNVIGVICQDSAGGQGPKLSSEVAVFSDHSGTNKALITSPSEDGFDIVACAVIASSKPEAHSGSVARSFQNMFKKEDTSPSTPGDMSWDFVTIARTFCFHCNIGDLLELVRCGFLDQTQLNRMLTESLRGKGDDDLHKCEIGLGECLSLQFANTHKVPMAYGWPVAADY